jgi:hypothetical protein
MIQNNKIDSIKIYPDSIGQQLTEIKIPDSTKNIVITIQSNPAQNEIVETEPKITDWLTAIGTILAVVLSLIFSGLSLIRKRRKNLVKTKKVTCTKSILNDQESRIKMEARIYNNSSVPLELYAIRFKYRKAKYGPIFPVSFKPENGKMIISPLNSKTVYLTAFRTEINNYPIKEVPCKSFSDLAYESKEYLKHLQRKPKSKIKVNKKYLKKVLNNMDILTMTNLDSENYFQRKMTTRETKGCFSVVFRKINEIFPEKSPAANNE